MLTLNLAQDDVDLVQRALEKLHPANNLDERILQIQHNILAQCTNQLTPDEIGVLDLRVN